MDYIRKTLIVSFIFSIFFLATLQLNNLVNNSKKKVLGTTTDSSSTLCNFLNSLTDKYCPTIIVSSTLPVNSIGQTKQVINVGQTDITDNPLLIGNISVSTSSDGKSATISFPTNQSSVAKIEYGTTAASLVLMTADSTATNSHKLTLTQLRPTTNYYYRIRIGDKVFDNNGMPYFFMTKGEVSESNMVINNVTAIPSSDGKSATITFTSNEPSVAIVEFGTTAAKLVLMVADSNRTTSHRLILSMLRPETNYYYRIRIGDRVFDNGGMPYIFKTYRAVN